MLSEMSERMMAHDLRSRKHHTAAIIGSSSEPQSAITPPIPSTSDENDTSNHTPKTNEAIQRSDNTEQQTLNRVESLDGPTQASSAKTKPPASHPNPWPTKRLLFGLIVFRCFNAVLTQTYYSPDEYWQSLEVAHNIVFGYGYLSWEWRVGLRGFSYPMVFALLYKILQLLHLDHPVLIVILPKILQATFSAVGDFYLYGLARRLWGEHTARWTLFCHLSSWFIFYTAARTLTNTTEMTMTICAMYYYPWPTYMSRGVPSHARQGYSIGVYLLLAAVSCTMRPTAAIMWLPLGVWHLARCRNIFIALLVDFIPIGSATLSFSLFMDRICYGKWVLVPFNFLRFNTIYNISSFYGTQPWYWYLTHGLPVIIGTHMFPFIVGVKMAGRPFRPLVLIMMWTQFVYSLLHHKEHRFLLPIVPIAMLFCGVCLRGLSRTGKASSLVLFLLVTNLPAALYMTVVHQRGTLDVMGYVQTLAHAPNVHIKVPTVLFLMPCHSTPFFSHVHANISMHFLECPPNLSRQHKTGSYKDEADVFYDDPIDWLRQEYKPGSMLPRYLVFFDVLLPNIQRFLKSRGYSKSASFFHTHVPLESRIGSHVLVYSLPLKIPLTPA